MAEEPIVIKNNKDLRRRYNDLKSGDLVVGRVSCLPAEEYMLFDLADRGVHMIPSGLSQLVCRSKVFQASIFAKWMLPETFAVHDIHQLQRLMQEVRGNEGGFVTKLDRKNAGMGVFRWPSLEDIFNQASLGVLPFPFVVQRFIPDCSDIRVLLMGEYVESYLRKNDTGFRNNLHFGGRSKSCQLTVQQENLCRDVMSRGKFPYAHIDLMVTQEGQTFLTEINLRGGIKGARIESSEYKKKLEAVHSKMVAEYTAQFRD